ncbi:hypothetical protein BC834DRAFT_910046, partial [Gloeopeniophorella convolvens]
ANERRKLDRRRPHQSPRSPLRWPGVPGRTSARRCPCDAPSRVSVRVFVLLSWANLMS